MHEEAAVLRARRAEVMHRLGAGAAIIPAAPHALRSGDSHHRYRPSSDLLFLTGFCEPEAVCVLAPQHAEHPFVLFVRPRDPEREVWDGPRAGVEGAREIFGADAAFPIGELDTRLPSFLRGAEELHVALGQDEDFDRRVLRAARAARVAERKGISAPRRFVDLALLLGEMRLRKSEREILRLRAAASATRDAHLEAMRAARPGVLEYEIEALLLAAFRRHGGEPGYTPIVAAGANATVLHYVANRARLRDGELLLIDAGAEIDWYTADVTRTFPVGPGFSDAQKALYGVVLAAQRAAILAVRPGATIEKIHALTVETITRGMLDIGLLSGDATEIIEKELYKRFYMHRTSHWLGMDVHDVGGYFVRGQPRPLEPGMVLTVEPGIYVPERAAEVDARFCGIGVRIEDDVLVTADGNDVLTGDIPKEIADLEAISAARA